MDINFFGVTNFRNSERKFGIKTDDRRRHFYAVGKTGMGKTEMLKNMAVQDIQNGHGMGFVDPHGEAAEGMLKFVPEHRIKDVIYFNPADTAYPIAFNIMESVGVEYRYLVASGLMSVFKKIWPDVWSARMEYILNNTVLALLEYPGSTLLGINRMLVDVDYRKDVIGKITDPVVKAFWVQEYARYTQRYEVEATAAIQNKVGQFASNPLIRNIIGQEKSSFDMREVMDGRKILILNLSKGRIGEDNSRLLGAMLITKLQLAAMSRVDIPEEERKDFYMYIDEFQNFASDSFVNILSEARKYRLCLILSHQYIAQLGVGTEAKVRDAVFGNVGTMVVFRVGAEDAEWLEKEFTPEFLATDFVNLGKYTIYVKLMIDGLTGRPFSAQTLPPMELPDKTFENEIIEYTRKTYSAAQSAVAENIAVWAKVDEESLKQSIPVMQNPVPERPLFDAKCAKCGKDTKVVFQPDGKRPVYCKACRAKMTRPAGENSQAAPIISKAAGDGANPLASPARTAVSRPVDLGLNTRQPAVSVVAQPRPAPVPSFAPARPIVQPRPAPLGASSVHASSRSSPSPKPVSLQEAFSREPARFEKTWQKRQGQEAQKRKEVDTEGLRQALGHVLGGRKVDKGSVLQPGETLKFQ
ncbi:MAG: type IV secretion system DNA-binding domain-containing protein [Candidatus Wildermuthbacteria bacterium]|nr:type IV secretion system DNA-binding domain-containing protein [Candidatus Wildermuthbacteria bacterium]